MSNRSSNLTFTLTAQESRFARLYAAKGRILRVVTWVTLLGVIGVSPMTVRAEPSGRLDQSSAPLTEAHADPVVARDRWYLDSPIAPSAKTGVSIPVSERWYLDTTSRTAATEQEEHVDKDRWYREEGAHRQVQESSRSADAEPIGSFSPIRDSSG